MNKQIEEMAKDLEEVETDVGHILVNETFSYVKEHKKYNPKKDFSNAHTKTFEELTAEEMFKKGYQKVGKDSVVLSREEYNRLLACEHNLNVGRESYRRMEERAYKTIEELNQELAQERKETAREILQELYIACEDDTYGQVVVDFTILENFAKQYGVEIKE